jgi:hypothetical protein
MSPHAIVPALSKVMKYRKWLVRCLKILIQEEVSNVQVLQCMSSEDSLNIMYYPWGLTNHLQLITIRSWTINISLIAKERNTIRILVPISPCTRQANICCSRHFLPCFTRYLCPIIVVL